MARNYNYNYRTSKKKGGNGPLTMVIILIAIIVGVFLIILNWGKITTGIYDMLGVEPKTSATGTTKGTSATTTTTGTETTASQTETTEQSGELAWYQQEIEYTRNEVNIEPLANELRNFIFSFSGQYGISFFDLTSGATFGINDIDYYQAASTIKVPLSLFVYEKVALDGLNLNTKLTYTQEDHEGGTGYIVNHGKVGEEFSIRTLMKYAIIYSDNIATNMLLREFGRDELKTFMRKLGGEIVDDVDNLSCPRDMALYMRSLYLFQKAYPDLGRELTSYFQKTHMTEGGYVNTPEADMRIVRYLPPEVQRIVAHKTGNATGAWHDVAIIIVGEDKPHISYVIAVMTYGVLYDEVNDVIANISKKVYEYMDNLKTY